MLELDLNVCHQLYQQQQEKESQRQGEDYEDDMKASKDKLSKRIEMLKRIPIFEEVDTKQLMPIALNIMPKNYSFGQYIVKQGEIPPGLVIIISGTC